MKCSRKGEAWWWSRDLRCVVERDAAKFARTATWVVSSMASQQCSMYSVYICSFGLCFISIGLWSISQSPFEHGAARKSFDACNCLVFRLQEDWITSRTHLCIETHSLDHTESQPNTEQCSNHKNAKIMRNPILATLDKVPKTLAELQWCNAGCWLKTQIDCCRV